jgi:3-hydroxyisobutyrate dehydrogenase-like beta-hydroxyacid dehydrogenase
MTTRICLLGFGEVGQTLVADLRAAGAAITAYDVLFSDPGSAPSRAAVAADVRVTKGAKQAVADADLVVCAVTAAQDVAAAQSVAGALKSSAYFLDVNSVSPGVKQPSAVIMLYGV